MISSLFVTRALLSQEPFIALRYDSTRDISMYILMMGVPSKPSVKQGVWTSAHERYAHRALLIYV